MASWTPKRDRSEVQVIRRSSAFAVLLALGLSFTVEARPPERGMPDEEGQGRPSETPDYFKSRYQWYVETWGENGKIDPEKQLARVRAEYEQYRRDLRAGRIVEVAPEGPVQPGVFRFIGPFTAAGRASTIEPHPTDPNVAYAGAAGGGVWKTVDQGANWRPLTDGLGNLSTGGIAIAPSNPNIVYFGTGEGGYATGFIPGIGIFKSTDAGETWRVPANVLSQLVYRMLVDRTNPELVLAFTRDGVQRSADGGLTWARTSDTTWADATDVAQVPNSPNVLHATFANQTANGRYAKSTDFGQTWTQKSSGLATQGTYGRTSVGVSADGQNVFLLCSGLAAAGYEQVGFYRSGDGGETFTRSFAASPNILGGQGWYDNVIAVDPENPSLVFAGGVGIYRSTNGGASFARTATTVHVDQHHFVFRRIGSQKVLWFANDGGIYLSTNGGTSFQDKNTGLGTRQYYGIAIDPARPNVVFAGAQDNGITRMGENSAENSGIT
ncbi:MAG: hypothetical protein JNK60_23325, partial [Acidobacteria bacterium]|nr:hypothetical protein [Acidobacteriota bacterium]